MVDGVLLAQQAPTAFESAALNVLVIASLIAVLVVIAFALRNRRK